MIFQSQSRKESNYKIVGKREEQIDRMMQTTVGMYADLQGIAGETLQEIEGLEFRALNPPTRGDAESA